MMWLLNFKTIDFFYIYEHGLSNSKYRNYDILLYLVCSISVLKIKDTSFYYNLWLIGEKSREREKSSILMNFYGQMYCLNGEIFLWKTFNIDTVLKDKKV